MAGDAETAQSLSTRAQEAGARLAVAGEELKATPSSSRPCPSKRRLCRKPRRRGQPEAAAHRRQHQSARRAREPAAHQLGRYGRCAPGRRGRSCRRVRHRRRVQQAHHRRRFGRRPGLLGGAAPRQARGTAGAYLKRSAGQRRTTGRQPDVPHPVVDKLSFIRYLDIKFVYIVIRGRYEVAISLF